MALGVDLDKLVKGLSHPRRRNRTAEHEGRTPQPGVPAGPRSTPNYVQRLHQGKEPQPLAPPPSDSGGFSIDLNPADLVSALSNLGGSPVGGNSNPVGALAKEELENAADVAKSNFGGIKPLVHIPNEKELRAAGAVTLPVSGGEAGEAAIRAGEKAASESGAAEKAAKVADILKGGPVRRGATNAAKKLEPDAVKAGRKVAADWVADLPKPVKVGGRAAGRTVTAPIKHPFTAPLALQAPAALIHGDPKEFFKGFEGKGLEASIANDASHVAPIVGEAASLPAAVLPSAFLTGKAGVNAIQGDSKELDELKEQWLKTGVLPAAVAALEGKGSPDEILKRFGERPLYSGLEASGAAAAVGRGAGAIAREATGGRVGGLERADLPVGGTSLNVKRRYSRDLIRQGIQRLHDRTPAGREIRPDTLRGRRALKEAANRFESGEEAIRKAHIHEDMRALKKTLPKKWGRVDRKSADVVNLAVERIIRHPETFSTDLPLYKRMLEAAAKQRREDGKPLLDRTQLAANKVLRKQIDAAMSLGPGRVESTVHAANAFIELQHPILEEMVDLKLIDPDQAAKASAVSFARVHFGATHGEPQALYRDLELQHKATRETFRGEARAALSGHVASHQTAKDRLQYAESGHIQAERSLATARAKLKDTLASRKTDKGRARVMKRLEQAQATVEASKQRVGEAKAEVRQTGAVLQTEARRLKKVRAEKLSPIEARHSLAKQIGERTLDKHGYPLDLGQITAEMQRQGIEPPGFLSHRTPNAGDFYRPAFGGAMADKGARTGESVSTGSQVGGIESLVRQLRRSRGLVDRAKGWNKAVTRFGIEVPGVATWSDAQRVLRDPARYGLDPAIDPVAVPRHPFMAKKDEVQGALEHQDPEIAREAAGKILHGALSDAVDGKLAPDTPVVFFPGKVAEELRSGAAPAGPGLRGAQAATTLFTRTVLPFSPGWYLGNGLDNALRTALAGINPAHFLVGSKVRKALSPEQQAELLAGAHYSSVEALNPHRSVEAVVRGYDPLSKGIRAAAEWSHRHGWKQAVVKFGPKMLSASSNVLIAANSFITEDLPQRGALGKLAAAEFRETQGSWAKALIHQREIGEDFARKVVDPDKMIQFQKDLEEVYGNYTRMSPAARKVLRNISPFWTWFRAAYRFVYLTMPAHHPIQTAALTAAARATQPEREKYGLAKAGEGGERPLPNYMQGAIPLPGGAIFPASNYSSFGYASDPLEAANRLILPQYRGIAEALAGRDWKGEELKGGERGKILGALWTFATSFVPGAPLFAEEDEGHRSLSPHLPKLPHPYDAEYVNYKREPTQQITVPKTDGGASSGGGSFLQSYAGASADSSGGFVESYAQSLGEGTAPGGSSSSGKAPWK